jgi:hypothetical protein
MQAIASLFGTSIPFPLYKPTPLNAQSDIASTLVYFSSLGDIFLLSGMALTGIGVLAWATHKKNSPRNSWGKRLFKIGALFVIIGFNFGQFLSLIKYVIGQ